MKYKIVKYCIFIAVVFVMLYGCSSNNSNKEPKVMREWETSEWETAQIFNVDDYGAKADGITDSTQAIKSAIEEAITYYGKRKIVFGKGKYIVNINWPEGAYIIRNAADLVIQGRGWKETEIIMKNQRSGLFAFLNCENVVVADLAVDWDPVPFTQGTVVGKNVKNYTFDVKIDEGFPLPDESWYTDPGLSREYGRWGMLFDSETYMMKNNVQDYISTGEKAEKIAENTYRFTAIDFGKQAIVKDIQVGDLYAQIIRPSSFGALFFGETKGFIVDGVTVYSCPNLVFTAQFCESPVIRNSAIKIREGSNRLISTNGDGFHMAKCRGTGPVIENNFAEATCDDVIAIGQVAAPIIKAEQSNELVAEMSAGTRIGDAIIVYNPRDGTVVGKAKVISLRNDYDRNQHIIGLDQEIKGITVKTDRLKSDHVLVYNASGSGFVIRNNTIRNHRMRGIFVEAHNGLIENNTIEGSGFYGIVATNDVMWPCGIYPDKITIKNNTVINAARSKGGRQNPNAAAIMVKATKYPDNTAKERIVSDISITGNTVINPPGAAIVVGAAMNAHLEDNIIIADKDYLTVLKSALIKIENSRQVKINNTEINDVRPGTTAAVEVLADVDRGNEGVEITNLKAQLSKNSKEIIDRR